MKGFKALVVASLFAAGFGVDAQAAEELVIRTSTTIGADDHLHDGKRLIVEGATLTLSGTHAYDSVTLRDSAVLTSAVESVINLTAETVTVDPTSRINVSAKGRNGNAEVGQYSGGSYGGRGGLRSEIYATNAPYGDFREPKELGTGGRNASSTIQYTRGGGAFELTAGQLALDGLIQSNGETTSIEGAGSGGSLLLRVTTLTLGQNARVEANGGGSGTASTYGGGGGGRVALYYGAGSTVPLPTQVFAKGGLSRYGQAGSAGSVYLKDIASGAEELVFNNESVPTTAEVATALLDFSNGSSFGGTLRWSKVKGEIKGNTSGASALIVDGATVALSGAHTFQSVILRNTAVMTSALEGVVKVSAETVDVDETSRIDVSAKGKLGGVDVGQYSGGSYGGPGGIREGYLTNAAYGDFREPRDLGTGGRNASSSVQYTRGGGAFELIANSLKLDGSIKSNGETIAAVHGAGSGGSLLLRVGAFILGQNARIEANGGGSATASIYGGGGGGRVAVYYGAGSVAPSQNQVFAKGGPARYGQAGAAGSIYLKSTVTGAEDIVFNNDSVAADASVATALLDLRTGPTYDGALHWHKVKGEIKGQAPSAASLVLDNANLALSGTHSFDSISLRNSSVLTSPTETAVTINAVNAEVDATSRIDVSAKGKTGTVDVGQFSGGSYGGLGGVRSGYLTNAPYGDFREPKDLGTGGRNASSTVQYTRGGGAFELTASTLKLEGLIQSNGETNPSIEGAGSGGSLLLRVSDLTLGEKARIEANGGGSPTGSSYGGGGGGRVALYYGQGTEPPLATQVLAKGGLSRYAQAGAAGSIYLKNMSDDVEELVFNNAGGGGAAVLLFADPKGSEALVLILDNSTVALSGTHTFKSVTLRNSSALSSAIGTAIKLNAGKVEVDATSRIDVSAKGNLGTTVSGYFTGGSYGGRGGLYSDYVTNEPYGDFREPIELGTGGRNGSSAPLFSRGGGALELVATELKLDGLIQSNGETIPTGMNSGSGSGGSLLLRVDSLTLGQQARIEANGGGSSTGDRYGGGGGGRVALYYRTLREGYLAKQVLAKGGLSYHAKTGAAGSVYSKNLDTGREEIVFNNDGVPVSGSKALLDLRNGPAFAGTLRWINVKGEIKGEMPPDPTRGSAFALALDNATVDLAGVHAYKSVTVRNAGVISATAESAVKLVADTVEVDATSKIDVSAKGRLASSAVYAFSGGSYGGRGGVYSNYVTNEPYGDFREPRELGTGGSASSNYSTRGGGAFELLAGTLTLDGLIQSNGQFNATYYYGSGSGGSLLLRVGSLTMGQQARIEANGGGASSGDVYGGGGGGRVALYLGAGQLPLPTQVFAKGGLSTHAQPGAAGSVYMMNTTTGKEELVFNNNDVPITAPPTVLDLSKGLGYSGAMRWSNVTGEITGETLFDPAGNNGQLVLDQATVAFAGANAFGSVLIRNTSVLTATLGSAVTLAADTIEVDATSKIDVSGKGAPFSSNVGTYCGGSHGGLGGGSASCTTNPIFGDETMPTGLGVGGRGGSSLSTYGGGALALVTRVFTLDGHLLADGSVGVPTSSFGGGAGGSLWVNAQQLIGSSTARIRASGGKGINSSGGGGGGRIAIYYAGMSGIDVLTQISVAPGTGVGAGGAGSLHLKYLVGSTAVLGTSVADIINQEVLQFSVDFNSAVSQSSINSATVRLIGPTGEVPFASINPSNPAKYLFRLNEALSDGNYELRIAGIRSVQDRGMDQDGNGVQDEASDVYVRAFTVDRTPPQPLVISAPLIAPAVNQLTVRKATITGTREDQTSVVVNGVQKVVLGSGAWSIPDLALAEGKSTLQVTAKDNAGNLASTSVTLNFNVDSERPLQNSYSYSGNIREVPTSIWVAFTETGSGLDLAASSIVLKRAGNTLSGSLAVQGNKLVLTPYSPLMEGSYSYDVRLQDKFGNFRTSSYSFKIDYTPPAPVVVTPYPEVTTSGKPRFSGTKEAGSTLRVRNTASAVVASTGTSATTWALDVTLTPGDNALTVDQTDAAGNVSPRTPIQIRFDDQAPGAVAWTAEPKGSGTSIKLAWPTYDEVANGNDIKEYRIYSAAAAFTSVANAQLVKAVTAGTKQLTINGLVRDEQRFYAVLAVDRQDLQQPTVTSVAVTPDDVVAPEEVINLQVVPGAQTLALGWTASANSAADLAGYALYVGPTGEQRINLSLADLAGGLHYTLSGLDMAKTYPLRLVAVDNDGNESAGVRNPGVTWLSNPQGLEVEGLANRFDAKWLAVTPANWVSAYRIYVADAPFNSVAGMTPRITRTASQLSGSLAGLQNGQTYHVAVTVVNTSSGENPQVQSVSVTPQADTVGPVLSQLNWSTSTGITSLLDGGDLESLGELQLQARDESGIARIEVSLDGQPLGQALQSGGGYKQTLDLTRLTDGDHMLGIKLVDTLDNVSDVSVEVDIDLDAPGKPTLQLQSPVFTTNVAQQTLIIRGQPGASAQVALNDDLLPSEVSLGSNGEAQLPITLSEGANQLVARLRHASRTDFGADSAPLNLTLDTTQPDAPAGLQTISKPLGVVQLSWSPVSQGTASGYYLYVASQPFTSVNDAGVSRVKSTALTTLSYTHKPTTDGTYYYRVSSVNKVGSESVLSAQKSAVADRVAPQVLQATYSSQGAVSADGRFAPARVDVHLQVTEPLRNAPFFSLDVPEGASIPVRMTQAANDPLYYQGTFDITTSLPSGLLYARVSVYDTVGNEGTEIGQGGTLRVDTQGPNVQQLSLLPESPVENLVTSNQGSEVQVIVRLNEEPVGLPQLTPQLNGQSVAVPIVLSLDAQSQPGNPIFTGTFRLPVNAGKQQVDLLGFAYSATDDLGNTSERIEGRRDFQVYQGDLPPLDIPQSLVGKALASGRVALTWKPVSEASVYRVMRRTDAESTFREVTRVRDANYEDDLPTSGQADGVYFYQVASIREHEGKEAVSQASQAVRVEVDSQPSDAPRQLQAEMNGKGVVLRWLGPEQAGTYTYNLYRANAGQGEPISIEGMTPLQTTIPELIALDSKPSDTEHAYTLTAVDAAGNESSPANSVYLNSGLLPVRDLKFVLRDGEAPLLQWDHSGKDVAGYNIYVGAQGATQKLNGTPIQAKQYQDQGLALPLTVDRPYSVTAVDSQGVESVPHALLLPAVRAELRTDQRLQRGVFNTLHYRISNNSQQALSRLRLRVNLDVNGTLKPHLSEYFDVAAGGLTELPIVVGGYPELPGVVPLSSELVYAPATGEEAVIQRNETVKAGESALLVQILAEELTRGGAGQVRLRIENPSEVATELVTAKASGGQASDEMRLVLEDLKGNVLSSKPIKAYLGNGLVTVRDGRTVARVGALDVLETGPFTIDVPAAAPDEVRLRLEADYLHYQTALPTELKIRGLRSSREVTLVESPYYGELTQISAQQVQAGDKLTITGRALKRDGNQPLAEVELSVVLNVRGFERVISVTTDAQGGFTYEHQTAADDSGTYQVSIVHPGISTRPQQGQFVVQGAAFSPASVTTKFPRNYEQLVTIVVDAGYDTALNNLRLEYIKPAGSAGLPTGIKAQLSPPMNLAAKKRGNLTVRISGDNTAAANGLLDYRIVADGLSKPLGQTRIQYSLIEARPVITVSPNQIRTGLKRGGDEQVETITLKNTGLDVLRNVRLSLLNSEGGTVPTWVSLRTAERPGDLAVGAATPISIAFKPGDAVPEGNYYISLRIQSDNHPQLDIAMEAAVTQSGQGGVIFQVSDIYTGTKAENGQLIPGLAGAKIKLQNRNVLTEQYSITSDSRGQALIENIPAGEYTYRISAWDHDDLAGQLWIKPGMTQAEPVFLMSKLVTVEWSVKEITLEDRYEVILDATFKTNVPTALVMIEPLAINLPAMRKGDVFQGELTLTNYGLIRADDVRASLPTGDARAKIEYLRPVPNTLYAGEVVIVPYRIVALQSFDPDDVLNGAAGCWSFNYQGVVNYASYCANGVLVPGKANVAWFSSGTACSASGGGSNSGGGGGGAGGWGGWGGSGGSYIPKPTPITTQQCVPDVQCKAGNCPGANGSGK